MTEKRNRHNQVRNQRCWQAHIEAHNQSGLSRAEYCRQHKLSYHAMIYWQRKFSKLRSSETKLVPVPFTHHMRQPPDQRGRPALKVILPDKIAIEVSDNFSPIVLTRLLATLEKR